MPKGVIRYFNDSKGYGFIEGDDSTPIFVHYSSIMQGGYKTLQEGQEVSYDIKESQRGLEAVNVQKV
ncbi:MAG: cold shock domain-containing protein [Candidatus Latescibacterota bacterium]|nr:MAG: cold shock domain-containing protein [Candidatus Latescibacterota bacterium]